MTVFRIRGFYCIHTVYLCNWIESTRTIPPTNGLVKWVWALHGWLISGLWRDRRQTHHWVARHRRGGWSAAINHASGSRYWRPHVSRIWFRQLSLVSRKVGKRETWWSSFIRFRLLWFWKFEFSIMSMLLSPTVTYSNAEFACTLSRPLLDRKGGLVVEWWVHIHQQTMWVLHLPAATISFL